MKEQLISFKVAKLAKEKGFDVPNRKYYGFTGKVHNSRQSITHKSIRGGGCLVPTQSLLQKWLRIEYEIHVESVAFEIVGGYEYRYRILNRHTYDRNGRKPFNTYEEALEKGLEEGLKLIKQ